jgi:hypothetical protein
MWWEIHQNNMWRKILHPFKENILRREDETFRLTPAASDSKSGWQRGISGRS